MASSVSQFEFERPKHNITEIQILSRHMGSSGWPLFTHFSAYHFKDNSAADVRATANENVGNFCYYVVPRNSNHADGITLNL